MLWDKLGCALCTIRVHLLKSSTRPEYSDAYLSSFALSLSTDLWQLANAGTGFALFEDLSMALACLKTRRQNGTRSQNRRNQC